MGTTPSMARAMPMTPALLPAQGRQRDGPRQRVQAAPPPLPPRPGRAGPPQGRHTTPREAGGKWDRAAPPQKNKPNGARDRGRTRGGARTAWNGPTGAQHRDRGRCARHGDPEGGGVDAVGAGAHAHAKHTRGIPEGQLDRARGTHRPHGMAYQRARRRDTRMGRPATHSAGTAGRGGGNGEDTKPGTSPNPSEPAASATHTQPGHSTRQGSSGALRQAPTPGLGSLRASPRGSHWRLASPRARQRRHPGDPAFGGATRWVSACSHGC